jgi:N-carbamoyl-L-amino-acid hydrolase
MSDATDLHIDVTRLQADLDALSAIGRRPDDAGVYRMALSEGDIAARQWLRDRVADCGLETTQDGAANLSTRLGASDAPCVMTGSHLDSVPGAGQLDGALGVLCGLEAIRVLHERDVPLKRPLELVAFTDEEGRFGGMFGSQAISGRLTPESIHTATDLAGVTIEQAMAEHGWNAMHALGAQREPGSIHAFVELHIEQGPVLDRLGATIGLVEGITGLFRWDVRLCGAANHAGTTPMDMRKDAFQGLAEFAGKIADVLETYGSPRSRATVGRVELVPGAANVIPGEARFALEVRDTDAATLEALGDAFRRLLSAISRRRGLMFDFEVVSRIEPVACSKLVMDAIRGACGDFDVEPHPLPSGAAHDTQMLAAIAPAGMIFVPSRDGRSHSPAEWTAWRDIEVGANVLLRTLHRLAT